MHGETHLYYLLVENVAAEMIYTAHRTPVTEMIPNRRGNEPCRNGPRRGYDPNNRMEFEKKGPWIRNDCIKNSPLIKQFKQFLLKQLKH